MKNMRFSIIVSLILAVVLIFTSCATTATAKDEGLKVVCTIFPQYDFVREIVGDNADVMLLLAPGVESHSYEPTPLDIKRINDADLFIYTGEHMEPWAETIVNSLEGNKTTVVDVSSNIELIDTSIEHEEDNEHMGEHEDEHNHEGEDHDSNKEHNNEEEHVHKHGLDPHIWLDPNLAQIMVENIVGALCEKDPVNCELYKQRGNTYKQKLQKIDNDFSEMVQNSEKDTVAIAGHFAYAYLFNRYDIHYITAYESSSSHDEPSVKKIIDVVDFMKLNDIEYVYHEQLVDPKVAKSVASQTGAELLVLHTVHNLTEQRLEDGTTYLDVMYENLEALQKGLN